MLGCLAFPVSHGVSKRIPSWSWNSGSPLAGGIKVSIQSTCASRAWRRFITMALKSSVGDTVGI